MTNRKLRTVLITLTAFFCLFATLTTDAMSQRKRFRADKDRTTKVVFNEMEIEVPAGAAEEELSVEWGNPELTGIKKPYGFKAIGRPYRFGPHGKKFAKGKHLKIRLNIQQLAGDNSYYTDDVQLYYINREKGRLEEVIGQKIDPVTYILEAPVRHFSEYVPGITTGFDDVGFEPYKDYVNNGEEKVSIGGLKLTIVSDIISLGEKGSQLRLGRVYWDNGLSIEKNSADYDFIGYKKGGVAYNNPFAISKRWAWDLPNGTCRPGGVKYSLKNNTRNIQINGKTYKFYDEGGACFASSSEDLYWEDGTRYFKDMVTDHNGNWIKYTFTEYLIGTKIVNYEEPLYQYYKVKRITKLEDSAGRIIFFRYQAKPPITLFGNSATEFKLNEIYENIPVLQKVEQQLADGSFQTLLTHNLTELSSTSVREDFTDALGRTTSYTYVDSTKKTTILYPNGAKSEYSYANSYAFSKNYDVNWLVKTQKFYYPEATTPFRTINYSIDNDLKANVVTVNDGIKINRYKLAYFSEKFKYNSDFIVSGYTLQEETLTTTGKLLQRTTNNYDFSFHFDDIDELNGFDIDDNPIYITKYYYDDVVGHLRSTTTESLKPDGTLGSTTTYQYEYDDWYNITRIIDPNGTETRMAYANTTSNIKLSEYNDLYRDALYPTTVGTTGWVGADKMVTKATLVTDPFQVTPQLKQSHYQYDSKGNLLRASEFHNGDYLHTDYTYDDYGNMTSKTDANRNQLQFEYSPDYNHAYLTKVKKPDETTIATFDYDINLGRKTMATDPKGNVYHYEYDAIGRLTKEWLDNSDPNIGVTRKLAYDDANNTVGIEFGNDSAGWQKGFIKFDHLFGKPATIQRWFGEDWITLKQNTYDTGGRLVSQIDGEEHTTTHVYDELNRKILTQLPDGATTTWAWNDRICTITDAKGNQKVQTYDLLDRLTEVQESPESGVTYTTSYTYDNYDDPVTQKTDSHLLQVINPKEAATTYTYDNLGRLIMVDYPQDGANPMAPEVYTYDNVGNLKTKTTAKGTKTLDYEYWAGYRLQQVTEPDGRVISYTYDANDNPLSQSAPGATYSYTYDARNRVTNMTATLDGTDFNFGYDYDVFGRMTGLTYPNRMSPVNYTYDELDRLQEIPGFVSSCAYDADQKLIEMLYGNGIMNSFTYDRNDRPTNISAGGGSLLDLNFTYDPVGNVTQINNDYYGYDGLNRLIWYGNQPKEQSAAANGTLWSYDGAGNMAGKESYLSGVSQGLTSFNYDKANRLWSMGVNTYDNDAAGARIGKTNTDFWGYIYDGESRLTNVTKNGVNQLDCAYDGNGMRVKKVENGKTTYYVYSGPNPLMEYSPTNGKYMYRIYAGKKAVAEEKDGVVKFYHKDHLGSTRVVTDTVGTKIAEYKFAPYGEKEVASGEGTEYGFTDKAEDVTTGLKYFGARFYDAECGRFLTADTYTNLPNDERLLKKGYEDAWFKEYKDPEDILSKGFNNPQEYNRYAYCTNNPINKTDPDGHLAQVAVFAVPVVGQVAMGICVSGMIVWGIYEGVKEYQHWSSINQMNEQVRTGKAPKTVERVDKGKIPGEKDHVHLKGGHAINKGGTWKHGGRELTKQEKEWLKENGWELPSKESSESESKSESKSSESDDEK